MPFDFDANPLTLSGLFPATSAPVQLDVYGYCQMACFYCFSNLNKSASGRELNQRNSLPALLHGLDRATADPLNPLGYFLREGYFSALSNTTDPFQREEKTHRATEAVLKWFRAHHLPLLIETKGNVLLEEWDRYAPLLDPARTCVYVSLSTLDDAIRKKCEPGALSVAGRLDLMRRLADLGCGVIAACNPYVPSWLPDMNAYCGAVKEAGAQSVLPFFLHFTAEQEAQIPAFYRDEIAKANVLPVFQAAHFKRWMKAAAEAGIHCILHPLWDAASGYASGGMLASPALAGRGRQALWLHGFAQELQACSRRHGGPPVLFSWRDVEAHLCREGVVNVPLRSWPFDTAWMNSSEGHDEFRRCVPKTVGLLDLLRWAFNAPWHVGQGIWADPRCHALFDRAAGAYETSENDLIGVWLPGQFRPGELAIDSTEFDWTASGWLDNEGEPHESASASDRG